MFENIFHLVLARPEGAAREPRAFTVLRPEFLFDFETGELGERNGVS